MQLINNNILSVFDGDHFNAEISGTQKWRSAYQRQNQSFHQKHCHQKHEFPRFIDTGH